MRRLLICRLCKKPISQKLPEQSMLPEDCPSPKRRVPQGTDWSGSFWLVVLLHPPVSFYPTFLLTQKGWASKPSGLIENEARLTVQKGGNLLFGCKKLKTYLWLLIAALLSRS